MASISFTAAREIPPGGELVIADSLEYILTVWPADRFVTGGSRGGDAIIGRSLVRARPLAMHLVVVPADTSQVEPWWEEPEFYQMLGRGSLATVPMPLGTTYKDRNDRLVSLGSRVTGFPAYSEYDRRSRRSGTWQTLRMARRARKPALWRSLDGCERGRDDGVFMQVETRS